MVENPVLFITFVRPEYARKTWNAIKVAQPKTLYFYSNKGRVDKEEEIERNEEIRSYIKEIDWDCDLHTWFREECVDVYTSLRGAIDWLFENEERGIVLEEDCVSSLAFFDFCDKMLREYENNSKIWFVSGDNFIEKYTPKNYDVFYSRYKWMFGWASWRSRWKAINWSESFLLSIYKSKRFYSLFSDPIQAFCYKHFVIGLNLKKTIDYHCWDYVMGLNMDYHGALGVYPAKNLISNIGELGEHTNSKGNEDVCFGRKVFESDTFTINTIYPRLEPNKKYDRMLFYYMFIKPNLSINKICKFIKLIVKKK